MTKPRVLFVYRVYGKNASNPVVQNQIFDLSKAHIDIFEFQINKGGIYSYITSIIKVRKLTKKHHISLIHAHYSFSGFISWLSFSKPVICSLMGSDVLQSSKLKSIITKVFSNYLWKYTIVKSKQMQLIVPKSILIPNGVNLDNFKYIQKEIAANKVGFDLGKMNIIFLATDINADVKNYTLAKSAVDLLGHNYVLHALSMIPFNELPYYYNAADLMLLTSISEGSPNVIKEALSCNCPIVSTDVGDVKELISNVNNCKITTYNHIEIANDILNILSIGERTNGRCNVKSLDVKIVSNNLLTLYLNI